MKREIKPSDTLALILITMAAATLIALAAGVIIVDEPLKYAIGLIFGAVVSCIRVAMLARAVSVSVDMESADAKNYMMGQYNLRMLLTIAAVVAGGMMREHLNIFALVIGLIIMQPSVYIADFIYERLGGEKVEGVNAKKAHRNS